ncbi:Mov34/MPN/PAD-1 family protein [Alicyclobacillus fodiniaquatilis]|uniref:Mov34/MPN/PAD-1 family protein n=1 Tax=Alicyclobacillus fodiniaquatilis TaxID=1661150 RepID=A0ABW4JJY3_9BACL
MTTTEIKGQMDLFAGVDGFELQVEDEATANNAKNKKAVSKASTPSKPVEQEPDVYDKTRIIYYAGHKYVIDDRTLKLEQIRQMLEEGFQYHYEEVEIAEGTGDPKLVNTIDEWVEFPELGKDRVEMVYDKEKGHIIPVLKGHKKGAAPILTEHPKKSLTVYNYLDTEDGTIYEIRRTHTGVFTAPLQGQGTRHFELNELFVPRIPLSAIKEVLDVFKGDTTVEHLAYIIWKPFYGYFVHWPNQVKTKVSVEGEPFMETDEHFIVLHIHSHNTMPAFFSQTDDADEIRTGFYAVVGHCERELPDFRLRYSCGGHFVESNPTDLISGNLNLEVNTLWK